MSLSKALINFLYIQDSIDDNQFKDDDDEILDKNRDIGFESSIT